jgi:PPOX class probable F420-dependent enzyme
MTAHPMSRDEITAFLAADPPHTAKVATVRADGRPHVAPVWFAVDSDGSILFNTGRDTVKGQSLARDPRIALTVDDERPPFTFVIIEGTAEIIDDLDQVRHWATILGGRYMGQDQAEQYGRRNGVPGELLIRVRPDRAIGVSNLAH